MRCERHDLACGPDGQCVLCRRHPPRGSVAPPRRFALGIAAIVCAFALAGGVTYGLRGRSPSAVVSNFAQPHAESDTASETTVAQPPERVRTPRRASIAGVPVIVYTTHWCPACKQAKAWLNGNGVAYEERDIETSREYAQKMRLINPRGSIPTIDIDGAVMVGFSEDRMVSMLERAAQRRSLTQ